MVFGLSNPPAGWAGGAVGWIFFWCCAPSLRTHTTAQCFGDLGEKIELVFVLHLCKMNDNFLRDRITHHEQNPIPGHVNVPLGSRNEPLFLE